MEIGTDHKQKYHTKTTEETHDKERETVPFQPANMTSSNETKTTCLNVYFIPLTSIYCPEFIVKTMFNGIDCVLNT